MSAKTARDHKLIRAACALFVLNAAIWLVIGVVSMMRIGDGGQMTTASR